MNVRRHMRRLIGNGAEIVICKKKVNVTKQRNSYILYLQNHGLDISQLRPPIKILDQDVQHQDLEKLVLNGLKTKAWSL